MKRFHLPVALALVILAGNASAHVVLEYEVAMADSLYKATFKVGHGCGGSATRQIVVSIPAGVKGARPRPKPGWALEITTGKLDQPYTEYGRTVTEDVMRVSWTARTPEDYLLTSQYDEFEVQAKLPAKAGTIYWPVNQVCVEGRSDWVEIPKTGQPASALKAPAARLDLMPAAGGGSHNH